MVKYIYLLALLFFSANAYADVAGSGVKAGTMVVGSYCIWGEGNILNCNISDVLSSANVNPLGTLISLKSQSLTIADSGTGSHATDSATTITGNDLYVTCSDTDGCDLTLSETGAVGNQKVRVINTSANPLYLIDSASVVETCANASVLVSQDEAIDFVYYLTPISQWSQECLVNDYDQIQNIPTPVVSIFANIDPNGAVTNWFIFRVPAAMTVTGVDCFVDAATSVVLTPYECDANGANCVAIEAAITCATTNTTEASGIDNSGLDAGDIIRITRGTVTGTPTQAIIAIEANY